MPADHVSIGDESAAFGRAMIDENVHVVYRNLAPDIEM
jgi:hypothetical protein